MTSDSLRETRAQLQGEMQQIAEHNGEITSEMADRFDSIEAQVRELDTKIRSEDIRGRFEGMQAETVTPRMAPGQGMETTTGGSDAEKLEAYTRWMKTGTIDERILNTSDDSAAVPDVLQAEIARKLVGISGAKQAVRVSQLDTKASVPQITTTVSVGRTAEGSAFTTTEPVVGEVDFTTDESVTASTKLTNQFLRDATPDMAAEVLLEHAEDIGRTWSDVICNGLEIATVSKSDGIMAGDVTGINNLDAAGAAAITAAELITLRYDTLPAQYWTGYGDLSWIMGQDTFAYIASLTGSDRPLMQPFSDAGIGGSIGMTLLGLPIHIDAGAPALESGKVTVALVARNAYRLIERNPGLVQQRDPFTYQASGQVQLNSYMDCVGRVVRPEAIATLTQA